MKPEGRHGHRVLRSVLSEYLRREDLEHEQRQLEELGVPVGHSDSRRPSLQGATILVLDSKLRVDRALLESADRLRLIVTTTSGHDHIDVAEAAHRGIRVARCPLARRDAVVATSIAMGLGFARDLRWLHEQAREGRWARQALPSRRMTIPSDLTVGVVGHGVIGAHAVGAWQSMGARVVISDPKHPEHVAPLELARRSDIVTLHCSLTPTSRGLVDREFVAAMPRGGILINTARGECVDLDALLPADHLGGIGLDVFPEEPWPDLQTLAALPHVALTPHAAGYYDGLGRAVGLEVVATVRAWLMGEGVAHEIHTDDRNRG
jgi:D-3-phosphoglycerate dehydrogenase / 2-oxoglutarate reductase